MELHAKGNTIIFVVALLTMRARISFHQRADSALDGCGFRLSGSLEEGLPTDNTRQRLRERPGAEPGAVLLTNYATACALLWHSE